MTTLQQTLQQIDQDAAALRQRAIAAATVLQNELDAIAAATALQHERDAAAANRAALQAEFATGPLVVAQSSFAELKERAEQLRKMTEQCERLHESIAVGAAELQRDAYAITTTLIRAMPEPSVDAATDAMMSAGADGLRYGLPSWALDIWPRRWSSAPGINSGLLYNYATAIAAEMVKKSKR